MSNLEIDSMIVYLGGNEESEAAVKQSVDKIITGLTLSDDVLTFTFQDKSELRIADNCPSSNSLRYMQTDDQLSDYIGGRIISMELRDAPDGETEGDYFHEIQFLAVQTSKGEFVVASHNEYTGNYGGFDITAYVVSATAI